MERRVVWAVLFLAGCGGDAECVVDDDCAGSHTACVQESCGCAAGYGLDAGGACVWNGVITDAWQLDPGVEKNPVTGALEFHGCDMGRATQMVTMPPYSRAQPLVMELGFSGAPAVGLGGRWYEGFEAITKRICLGAVGYAPESAGGVGTQIPLAVMPAFVDSDSCGTRDPLTVDRVAIERANDGECPAPGTVPNGDFEAASAWNFTLPWGAASIDGVGQNGSRGLHLTVPACKTPPIFIDGRLSLPSRGELPSPALTFVTNMPGTQTRVLDSSVAHAGEKIIGASATTAIGNGTKTTLCIPPALEGTDALVSIGFNPGSCNGDEPPLVADIDNIRFVDEPACGTDASIANSGFEANGVISSFRSGSTTSIADPANAHTGNGVLRMSLNETCQTERFRSLVVVPPPAGSAGPALRFFYKQAPSVNFRLTAVATSAQEQHNAGVSYFGIGPPLVYDGAYHEAVVCLDPKLEGRGQVVTFRMFEPTQTMACYTTVSAEQAFVDDLSVTTDPSCPAQ